MSLENAHLKIVGYLERLSIVAFGFGDSGGPRGPIGVAQHTVCPAKVAPLVIAARQLERPYALGNRLRVSAGQKIGLAKPRELERKPNHQIHRQRVLRGGFEQADPIVDLAREGKSIT